jgi:hypothetical protein
MDKDGGRAVVSELGQCSGESHLCCSLVAVQTYHPGAYTYLTVYLPFYIVSCGLSSLLKAERKPG